MRLRLVTVSPERSGTPPAKHNDLAGIAARTRRKCRERKRGPRPKTATVVRREARVPRHGTQGASQAPGLPRHVQAQRVPPHPCACRRTAHPSSGGDEFKTRARMRRGNERGCLKS